MDSIPANLLDNKKLNIDLISGERLASTNASRFPLIFVRMPLRKVADTPFARPSHFEGSPIAVF
jgi:hypothetical protein